MPLGFPLVAIGVSPFGHPTAHTSINHGNRTLCGASGATSAIRCRERSRRSAKSISLLHATISAIYLRLRCLLTCSPNVNTCTSSGLRFASHFSRTALKRPKCIRRCFAYVKEMFSSMTCQLVSTYVCTIFSVSIVRFLLVFLCAMRTVRRDEKITTPEPTPPFPFAGWIRTVGASMCSNISFSSLICRQSSTKAPTTRGGFDRLFHDYIESMFLEKILDIDDGHTQNDVRYTAAHRVVDANELKLIAFTRPLKQSAAGIALVNRCR